MATSRFFSRMSARATWALLVVAAGAVVAACSGTNDAEGGDEEDVVGKAANIVLFGNDRVGRMLQDHPEKAPNNFREYEELFKVGRKCARTDSKEIFVIEETGSRDDVGQTHTDKLLPRAVITGCNTDPQNPDSIRLSYSLMAALVSSQDPKRAADPLKGDTIVESPLEVMALDDTTGLYNFYKFFPSGPSKPATILRVERAPDGSINDIILAPGAKTPVRQPAVKDDGTKTQRCYGCHVSGAPIMNELKDPWTNWVSFRANALDLTKMSGETLSIVREAVPNATTGRSSLAKGLEDALEAGMRAYVVGQGSAPDSGYGKAVLAGVQPGGLPRLLKSVFCQTDLNYVSAFDTVPVELFYDPAATASAALQPPVVNQGNVFPTLMPIRSELDKRVENWLMRAGYVTAKTVLAIRLVDDEHDIFSDSRCKLLDALGATLPKTPAEVDALVRKTLSAKATTLVPAGARRTYLQKLVDAKATPDDVTKAQAAYAADVTAKFATKTRLLETAEGRTKLRTPVVARMMGATALFPTAASPLPEAVIIQGSRATRSAPVLGLEGAAAASKDIGGFGSGPPVNELPERETEFDAPKIQKK